MDCSQAVIWGMHDDLGIAVIMFYKQDNVESAT